MSNAGTFYYITGTCYPLLVTNTKYDRWYTADPCRLVDEISPIFSAENVFSYYRYLTFPVFGPRIGNRYPLLRNR